MYIYIFIHKSDQSPAELNCEPMCLLSAEYYAEDRPLSKATIKGLADLSKLVSADEGRELLTYEIECRSRGGMKDGKRSYHRDLILSDVTEAINKVKTKQLENVTQTIAKSQPKRMLESTPFQTSDETSDQTQQDRLSKKQRLGLLSPIGRVVNEASSSTPFSQRAKETTLAEIGTAMTRDLPRRTSRYRLRTWARG